MERFEIRETYLVDGAVGSSICLPMLFPGETAQIIVEIQTVLEQVICSGDGTFGIQSDAAGCYVHRSRKPPQIRGADSEFIAELATKIRVRFWDRCNYCVRRLFAHDFLVKCHVHRDSSCVLARFFASCAVCPVVNFCLLSRCTLDDLP